MTKFSERLKELRTENSLSINELAVKSGLSRSAISSWELGTRVATINALYTIAKFFNVSTDYLLGLEDEFGNKIK